MSCEYCGVEDALGRHGATCVRALQLGLPRLAEDEEPIPPDEDATEDERVDVMETTTATASVMPVVTPTVTVDLTPRELWASYTDGGADFDAVIFDSELDALRHAVAVGRRVHALELGRSLREQVSE